MSEENLKDIPQIPDPGVQKAAEETSLREELARVRSRGRVFKIVAAVLGVVFIVLSAGGYIVYRKISQAKAMLEAVSQGFAPLGQGIPTGQRIGAGGEAGETDQLLPSSGPVAQQLSGLGLLSMPEADSTSQVSGESAEAAKRRAEDGLRLMKKYSERPIMKEFLAELQSDPAFAGVKKDPMALMGAMRNSKSAKALMMKYAQKPAFMKVLLEMSRDPELRQFSGGAAGAVSMPGMPPAASAVQPPGGEVGEGEEGDLSFDSSAISGPATAQPAGKTVKAPPAIDSGR